MTTHVPKILGTVADVHVGGVSARRAAKLERAVIEEITRLETIFNLFEPTSAINRLRAGDQVVALEIDEVMALAAHWRRETAGAFNPFVDAMRHVWIDAERQQKPPADDEVARLVAEIAGDATPIDQLNLNAIAKGWIVDRSIDAVMDGRRPPATCWVSVGGDVAHRGDGHISVGIEDPFRPFDNAAPLASVRLANQALATSGGARRFWTIGGRAFSHVLDPRTGTPVDHVASATVIAADAATADVLATAATVLSIAESVQLIDATTDAACLIVASDRTIHTSEHWPATNQ